MNLQLLLVLLKPHFWWITTRKIFQLAASTAAQGFTALQPSWVLGQVILGPFHLACHHQRWVQQRYAAHSRVDDVWGRGEPSFLAWWLSPARFVAITASWSRKKPLGCCGRRRGWIRRMINALWISLALDRHI